MAHDLKLSQETLAAIGSHLEQWRELSVQMKSIVSPIIEHQEKIREVLRPIIAARRSLQGVIKPISTISTISFPQGFDSQIGEVSRRSNILGGLVRDLIAPAFEKLRITFEELPPRTQEALILLGEHGWYLDLELPIPALWQLQRALVEGNVKEAEQALVEYFEEELDRIEGSVVARFPARRHIIAAAFGAHRNAEYALSIPVFLSQADGICKEVIGQELFRKRNGKPGTAAYVDQLTIGSYQAALLTPLSMSLPIMASSNERKACSSQTLNRHAVLHGEFLDYDTKENGLRAISLLNYVVQVLDDIGQDKNNDVRPKDKADQDKKNAE